METKRMIDSPAAETRPSPRCSVCFEGNTSWSGTSGKTGGGSAFFASLTRRPLIPWEDGSAR